MHSCAYLWKDSSHSQQIIQEHHFRKPLLVDQLIEYITGDWALIVSTPLSELSVCVYTKFPFV